MGTDSLPVLGLVVVSCSEGVLGCVVLGVESSRPAYGFRTEQLVCDCL